MYQEGPLQVSECLHSDLASGITAQPGNTCKRGIQGKAHRESVTSLLLQSRVKSLVKIKNPLWSKKDHTCSRPQTDNLPPDAETCWQLTPPKEAFPNLIQALFQLKQTLKTTYACFLQLVLGSSTFLPLLWKSVCSLSSPGDGFTL